MSFPPRLPLLPAAMFVAPADRDGVADALSASSAGAAANAPAFSGIRAAGWPANAAPYGLQYLQPSVAANLLHQQALQQAQQQQQHQRLVHQAQHDQAAQHQRLVQAHHQQQQQQLQQQQLQQWQHHDIIEIEDSDDDEDAKETEKTAPSPPKSLSSKQKSPDSASNRKPGENTSVGNVPSSRKDKDKQRSLKASKSSKRKSDSTFSKTKETCPDGSKSPSFSLKAAKKRSRPSKSTIPAADSWTDSRAGKPSAVSSALYESPPRKKVLSLDSAPKPVVVVQNWSKEGLLQELGNHEKLSAQGMLKSFLKHCPNRKALDGSSDPSSEAVTMSMAQLRDMAASVSRDQAKSLREAVDASFCKCAAYVDDLRGDRTLANSLFPGQNGPLLGSGTNPPLGSGVSTFTGNVDGSPVKTDLAASVGFGLQGGATISAMAASIREPNDAESKISFEAQQHIIKYQQEEMIKLRKNIADMMEEKKRTTETFTKEQAYLKDQVGRSKTIHARSVRAFMKASVTSLRWLREKVDVSDDDEDGVEAQLETNQWVGL